MTPVNFKGMAQELLNLESMEGVIGSALVKRNGLLITSRLPRDIDDRKFAAMAAAMFGAIITATQNLKKEKIVSLLVEYEKSQIVVLEIDAKNLIVALLELNINYGLILIELEEIVRKLKNQI